jgi:V/A-type H+-transporting ATPase subunit I
MGVATIILGALQGCYLGDFHTRFLGMEKETYPYLVDPLGINPMAETITVLQIALIIGLIHLNLGLVLGAVKNIQAGNRRDLISGQISLFVLQPSVAVLICKLFGWWGWASLPLTSTPMLIALAGVVIGALMLLIPKGLLGIFDITGYLGNWLSYARILALGLATSGIAMAINVLTKMTADVFIILGVIVCFFGHVFNIALQALGALIHSLRLHYVEFFSKFYEGGGNEFDPFKVTREYTVLERR